MGSGIAQNTRVYWLAFVVYWGILLFGYDGGVAGSVVSQTFFQSHFDLAGKENANKLANVSSNVVSVLQAGAFFGALGSAPISSRIGRQKTLLIFAVVFIVGAILQTVASGGSKGLAEIYAGRTISGIGIGALTAVAPTFVSECAPKEVRGRITGLFQVMVSLGNTISYWINYGISLNPTLANNASVWRIPFGVQLVPIGIMLIGLFTVKESPRWLVSVGRSEQAREYLAFYRKLHIDSDAVTAELTEIEAAVREEKEARESVGLKSAFIGPGNWIRFVIAFFIMFFQQWSGQNSIGYYAPQIFTSIGYTGTTNSLLASGIYGVVKFVSTITFVLFGIERMGRKLPLIISAVGMGISFFIVGAILKTHPTTDSAAIGSASKTMAAFLYIYGVFFASGCGPVPWVYVADIFPTATRHYGLAVASASQWLFNFNLSKVTLIMVDNLGYKLFFMFGALNLGGLLPFALLIPETKGRSLEEMDIIFGSVTAEKRRRDIDQIRRDEVDAARSSVSSTEAREKPAVIV